MCVALVSAITKNPTRPDVAMTGEITLRGRVIAVGGLKAKILAARQHSIKTILIPEENRDDVEEILTEIGPPEDSKIIFVSNMDEVLTLALTHDPFSKPLKPNTKSIDKKNDEKNISEKKSHTSKSIEKKKNRKSKTS